VRLSATALASLALLTAVGCGGGVRGPAAGPSAANAGSGAGAAASAYSWRVPTSGAAPSIARENEARGTRAWRLAGPAELIGGKARGAIAGYVSSQTVQAGQTQSVYVRAPGARWVTVRVFRMGWYGGTGGRLVLSSVRLAVRDQPPCARRARTGLTECDWHATLSFAVPAALTSGVYIAKLSASTGAQSDCLFVIRPPRAERLIVQIPTATYEAYNAWGGNSLYAGAGPRVGATGTSQGVEVSYDRPYDSETGAGQFFMREVAMVRFLERYGYPVGYTTGESIDGDPAQLDGAAGVIDVGHSEYWSARQAHAFATARDRGVSLMFVSSDTAAWRVRFAGATSASSEAGAAGHRIVGYKELATLDPHRAAADATLAGGAAALVGSAYDGCITPRVARGGPPVYRYYAWRPAASLRPRWLFAGTGVSGSSAIAGIVGYELDERAPLSPAGTRVVGSGTDARCMSASEPSPLRGTTAQSTLYRARSGALVFATGTLGWIYGLDPVPQASPDVPRAPDARVVAMTRNLLARVLAGGGA
jgi:hypothetical protein